MKQYNKKHDSCIRVLEFLKLLFQKDVDIKEINKISDKFVKSVEAPETFLKYISTLEASGLSVIKKDKKYSLNSPLYPINLSEKEINLIADIYEEFNNCCVENLRSDLDNFITIISKCLDYSTKVSLLHKIEKVKTKDSDFLSEKALSYQRYVDLEQKLVVTYKNEVYHVEPKKVEIENKKIYLLVFNSYTSENMKLLTDDIENITVVPLKNTKVNMASTVVFEVFDGLIYNYRLRENERIQTFSNHNMVIINYGEDRKELIRRLLKYGENCKILSPLPFKEEFLKELSLVEMNFKDI